MGDYRVLVTGSRDWDDQGTICRELDSLLFAGDGTLTVVHGARPRGADAFAQAWALSWRHASSYGAVTPEPHPADWSGPLRRAAGIQRNADMVALGADLCLAFLMPCTRKNCTRPGPHDSHGAADCADRAEKAGIEVRRFRP